METSNSKDDALHDTTNSKDLDEDEVRWGFCQIFAPSDNVLFTIDMFL